jgi:hypothetical protein
MEKFCQAHLRRTGERIPATREVNGEAMCLACFRGSPIDPLEERERFGLPFCLNGSKGLSPARVPLAASSDNATGRGETASRKIHSPTASVAP